MVDSMKERVFDKLYRDTFDDVSKYVVCKCSNINDVSDIIQSVYLEVFKIINKDNYDLLTKRYIIGIARHKVNDYYRCSYKSNNMISYDSLYNVKDVINIERDVILKCDVEVIWKYLKRKPVIVSKIFYLYYYMGLSINDIAFMLGVSISVVKNHLYRTISELKLKFKEDN